MATLIDKEFFARLNALNEKFAASVPDTLARLRGYQAAFNPEAPDALIVTDLHQTLHTTISYWPRPSGSAYSASRRAA
ncbi:hypothetical protein LP420_00530 [Massilia sp. B-10]|nr:hypothetical protein LP420_00530 [Massilia sp. B-10]